MICTPSTSLKSMRMVDIQHFLKIRPLLCMWLNVAFGTSLQVPNLNIAITLNITEPVYRI